MLTNFNQIVLCEPIIKKFVFEFKIPSKLIRAASIAYSMYINSYPMNVNYVDYNILNKGYSNYIPNFHTAIEENPNLTPKGNINYVINLNNYNFNTTVVYPNYVQGINQYNYKGFPKYYQASPESQSFNYKDNQKMVLVNTAKASSIKLFSQLINNIYPKASLVQSIEELVNMLSVKYLKVIVI